jgi:hypothetical protein
MPDRFRQDHEPLRGGQGDLGSASGDEVLADWAEPYGEQTVKDHAALLRAIESARVKAVDEL